MLPGDSESEIEGGRLRSGRIFRSERGETVRPKEEVAVRPEERNKIWCHTFTKVLAMRKRNTILYLKKRKKKKLQI